MDQKPSPGFQGAVGLGYQFLAAMIICVGGGYWLDQRRGGGTAFTLGGVALAFIYGIYEVWKLVRQIDREERDAKK